MAEDEELESPRRLDAEWLTLNALRETFGIANRGAASATYLDVLEKGHEIAPRLFDPHFSLLLAGQEPPLVREYRQRAEAKSLLDDRPVSPLDLLDGDLAADERLLEAAGGRGRDQLRRSVSAMRRAREWFEERVYSEHKLIARDVYAAERPDLPCTPRSAGSYREYVLPFERALRIRVLHPDKPEHTTGADLVYEFCDEAMKRARIAFVQYKMWDGQSLRFSDAANLASQLSRMQDICCRGGLCASPEGSGPPASYRLPYCAAFLRPTDRLQRPDAALVSSGLHVPACVATTVSLENVGGRILRQDPIRGRASQRLFEELFHRNMLGSGWFSYEEVENLYREHKILDSDERIVVHAQEYPLRHVSM